MIFIYLLATSVILYFLIVMPRGRLTHNYEVFIAAEPKTVWDTFFIHVRGCDYRPGTRLLGYEVLSENPLTVRITVKANFLPMPLSVVETFELYEPYARYKLRGGIGSVQLAEEGEFVSEPGGTRLRFAVTAPRRGLLLPLLARRRVERNICALQDVCEGRQI
jgi:hypothetical protein